MPEFTVRRHEDAWAVFRGEKVWDWPFTTSEGAEAQRARRETQDTEQEVPEDTEQEVPEDTYPVMRGWAPRYLVEWLFDQDRIWITAAGEQKFISQMEPSHLLNTLLFLERNEDDLEEGGVPKGALQHTKLYQAIKRRLLERLYGAA